MCVCVCVCACECVFTPVQVRARVRICEQIGLAAAQRQNEVASFGLRKRFFPDGRATSRHNGRWQLYAPLPVALKRANPPRNPFPSLPPPPLPSPTSFKLKQSDDEYHYSDEDGGYDYGSDAEEMDEANEEAVQVENTFYDAEDIRDSNPAKSLELYRKVVALEESAGQDKVEYRFKALEAIVQLNFRLGKYDDMVSSYETLLSLMDSVTRNESADSINKILDTISNTTAADAGPAAPDSDAMDVDSGAGTSAGESNGSGNSSNNIANGSGPAQTLARMYEITLDVLKRTNNDRLWFNTNIKMGKMYLMHRDYARLAQVVRELHAALTSGASKEDANRGSYLLEVYALEIAMYGATQQKTKLREAYAKSQQLNAAIQDPRIMGTIHEAGGKMLMEEGAWKQAYDELFDGFRAYQEAGNPRARQCLKLVVLANMIALSTISPFDSQEAKVYKDDPEIQAMVRLRSAFENNDINEFERVLNDRRSKVLDDPTIKKYVVELLRKIRSQVLLRLVRPYNRVKIGFLANEVNIPEKQVEELLVDLIMDGQLDAKIDQQAGILVNSARSAAASKKYVALQNWVASLGALRANLHARVNTASARGGDNEQDPEFMELLDAAVYF